MPSERIVQIPVNPPTLRQEVPKFDFNNPSMDPVEVAKILSETMLANNGIGLSANQCGMNIRAFVMKSNPIICCFNPRIVDSSEERVYMEEGCLSFPGLIVNVKRPAMIKVRYTQPNGEVVTDKFGGMTARIFQHELDHLDGITMLKRASVLERERALKKWKKQRGR